MRLFCILLATVTPFVAGYNYLIFDPLFGHSHTNFIGKVADTLTNTGHNVTVLMPVCDPEMKKRTGLRTTKDVIMFDVGGDLGIEMKKMMNEFHETMWDQEADIRLMMAMFGHSSKMFASMCDGSMSAYSDRMSLYERAMNFVQSKMGALLFSTSYDREHSVLRKHFGEDFYSIDDIISRMSLQFINTNPYLDFPFPTIQKNVAIGGISVDLKKDEKLSEEWDRILSLRSRTVLVSFGSVAHSCKMPYRFKTSLLEVFQTIPDTTFIWKYEDDNVTFASHVDNVYLSKWVPQNALLADARLSMFLTHGGLGSTNELAHMGKPAVMIPLFADQPHNAAMLSRHGGAEILSKFDLANPEIIKRTFEKVLNNESYSENARRLSEMLRNQPISAKELFVKHCEFAARFGKLPNLDPYGRQLSFIQYFLLDVLAVAISIIFIIVYILFYTFKRCFCSVRKVKKD